MPLQIRPEQPTPSLQNCHAHSLKLQKHFSQLATYLAYFSVTRLATSLKLAKFSVTERTAAVLNVRYSVHLIFDVCTLKGALGGGQKGAVIPFCY